MAADILTLTVEEFAKWNSENPYVAPQPAAEPAPGQAAETGIPKRFQDYQGADFSLDGFNALNPFQQAQIQGVLGGMIGRYKNPLYTDPYDDEDNGVGNWTSSEKYELRKPQGNDEWSAFLAEFYPERSKFLGGSTYGVQDEMRYIHSLFDDENMQIPDEPAAIADEVAPYASGLELCKWSLQHLPYRYLLQFGLVSTCAYAPLVFRKGSFLTITLRFI